MSVPQFGAWDQNAAGTTDYTVMFTKARANKRQQKTNPTEIRRRSLGSERDFVNVSHHAHTPPHHVRSHTHHEHPIVMGKKRIRTYIKCCIRPTMATP
ncbi:hypothetical protein VNO78_26175 [Psophocarpus tetragonolobus]|uniref:RIN4 pathogenic type III effector avirulence factor Avr cleavage site domain-containing protein n=1 Tax=Psophocarpus tetragonolobus TaxID=3891 RepID=A0AAN9RZ63_PSOTE